MTYDEYRAFKELEVCYDKIRAAKLKRKQLEKRIEELEGELDEAYNRIGKYEELLYEYRKRGYYTPSY